MATEFVVQSKELTQALRFVLPTAVRGRKAQTEFIAVNANNAEVEFSSTSVSSFISAQVISPGNARVPASGFEWFRKIVKSLKLPSVRISIVDGQVKAEGLTYSHPEITSSALSTNNAAFTGTRVVA
jgi:hypothetical protein